MKIELKISRYQNQDALQKVELFLDNNSSGIIDAGNFTSRKRVVKAVKEKFSQYLNADDLEAAVRSFVAAGCPKDGLMHEVINEVQEKPLHITLRHQTAPLIVARVPKGESPRLAMMSCLRQDATTDDLIEWGGEEFIGALCAVDLDWHGTESPYHEQQLLDFVSTVTPRPFAGWRTRNGGLRMLYFGPHADLFAAVGAVRAVARFPQDLTGVELKAETRHPGKATVRYNDDSNDLASIMPRDISGEDVDQEAWAEWLADHGLSIGRFSHDSCIIDPGHESRAPSPVEVRPSGIMCHSCGGRTGLGWRSASYLMQSDDGTVPVGQVALMVRCMTHYEHASLVLREYVPAILVETDIMKTYYKAMLVAYHGADDPRIADVFRDRDMIRFNGFWGTAACEKRDPSKIRVTMSNLPACRTPQGEVIAEQVEAFSESHDLESRGYPAVYPVFGHRIGTFHPCEAKTPRIIVPSAIRKVKPRYLKSRMPKDEAWGILREVYPGIDAELIEMLIYCRGLVERGCTSLHPKFLFDGVSGSGKTSHPHIAAAICGDRCTDVVAVTDDERIGQKIHEAMRVGSFATIDEVVKSAKKARVDPRTFLTFILNLSAESSVHALYIGQIRFGWLPIICLTDTDYPEDVLADEQLGRRLIYRHLGTERLAWETSTRKAGLLHWADPRSAGGDVQSACDAVLSHVIDDYFASEPPDLVDVVERKGFRFLNADGHAERRKLLLRDLFNAWLSFVTPEAYKTEEPGWKTFDANDSSDLARLWSRVHDEGNPASWARMNERSWAQAAGRPYPIRGEVEPMRRGNSNVVRLRFLEQRDGQWGTINTGGV